MQNERHERVGVIGLGIIGSRVADVLRENGCQVYVWSRTPRPEPNFLSSPSEVAEMSDTIQIFVTNGEALVEVVEGMKDSLTKRHTIINNSTSDPDSVVEAYHLAKEAGASFLDAPFTGSKDAAAKGALVYYVGGDPAVLDTSRYLLERTAKEILYLGRVGEATVLKLATNMISAATVEVLSEALGLINAAGVDPGNLVKALEHNACSSGLTGMKLPNMITQDYDPHFSLRNMFKDSQYALSLGKRLGIEMPALSTTASVMFRTIQDGSGDLDYSVLAAKYQSEAGSEDEPS